MPAKIVFSREYRTNRKIKFTSTFILYDVALDSVFETPADIVFVIIHGEYDNICVWVLRQDGFGNFHTVHIWHRNIDDQKIRLKFVKKFERFFSRRSFSNNDKIFVLAHKILNAIANHRM